MLFVVLLLFGLTHSGCTSHEISENVTAPADSLGALKIYPHQINKVRLSQGLEVIYYTNFFARDIRDLDTSLSSSLKSFTGPPISELNHQFGKNEVFGSGTNRGVAMKLSGYINFPQPGTYSFQALSNDGIQFFLDNMLVIDDPKQHSDQLSEIATIQVTDSGWVPIGVSYFQRKGTAALKLFWKIPGDSDFKPVPAAAYGFIK